MSGAKKTVRVGTRKSQLAMIQTTKVISWLKEKHPHLNFEIISMTTTGDKILETALAKIGEKNLFTKELENALADGRVDLVVHSLKDLPTTLPPGMVIGAVCKRDDPRDAVVMHEKHSYTSLAQLPKDSVVGTSSLRRGAQLKRRYPELQFENIRGNLNTRLKKLDGADMYDCIILAKAGLDRMNWQARTSCVLEPTEGCMYAVCQGAMAVECREGDQDTYDLLSSIHDYHSTVACVTERAFLRTLEGGCSVPIGVYTEFENDKLSIHGGVYSIDGTECLERHCSTQVPTNNKDASDTADAQTVFAGVIAGHHPLSHVQAAYTLGASLARDLISAGAMEIVQQAKATITAEIMEQKKNSAAKIVPPPAATGHVLTAVSS